VITAVDSNVIYDVLTVDASFYEESKANLARAHAEGQLVACEAVWAEVAAGFEDRQAAAARLHQLRIGFVAMDELAAVHAGSLWRVYRRQGGTRQRILADFLIGAHALHHADRLLTRDRGFYRAYFEDLPLVDPTA
jgi:predicted nucleic acid-binding protein